MSKYTVIVYSFIVYSLKMVRGGGRIYVRRTVHRKFVINHCSCQRRLGCRPYGGGAVAPACRSLCWFPKVAHEHMIHHCERMNELIYEFCWDACQLPYCASRRRCHHYGFTDQDAGETGHVAFAQVEVFAVVRQCDISRLPLAAVRAC